MDDNITFVMCVSWTQSLRTASQSLFTVRPPDTILMVFQTNQSDTATIFNY